jgi:hypothetical protein
VTTLASLEAGTRSTLRERLAALPGVRRVIVDEAAGVICLLSEPEAEHPPLFATVRNVLLELGADPAEIPVEIAVAVGRPDRQRVRFLRVERVPRDETHVGVRVALEWQGTVYTGEAIGELGAALELRTAALAALDALHQLTGNELNMRLTGVKQIRAFDADLTVASVQSPGPPPRHFVGTVMDNSDPLRGAAVAVLSGLNRMLGNYLSTSG